jgi:preprotein translocase subunit SecE
MVNKIKTFFESSRRELKRVNWPTRKETVRYTLFVVGFSLAVAAFLGLLDFIFIQVLEGLVI